METTIIVLGLSVFLAIASAGFTIYSMRKVSEELQELVNPMVDGYMNDLQAVVDRLDTELPNVKRYYSDLGKAGNIKRRETLAERALNHDLATNALGFDPELITSALGDTFPELSKVLKKNPDLIAKFLPKLKQYADSRKEGGATESDVSEKDLSRIWSEN